MTAGFTGFEGPDEGATTDLLSPSRARLFFWTGFDLAGDSLKRRAEDEGDRTIRKPGPVPTGGVLADIWQFFVRRPAIPTLVRHTAPEERADYSRRILERIGIDVTEYHVLNIHRIGVDAPPRFAFEALRRWAVVLTCWPRHFAALERVGGGIERIRVYLLDRRETLFGFPSGFLGFDFIPLFQMDLLKLQDAPSPADMDNGRFLLYACRGGYPIGILAIYVRSSIAARGEEEESQVFFVVSFDFYGKKNWPAMRLVKPIWERIHNRVTANILNRFKDLCEARFRKIRSGASYDDNGAPLEKRNGFTLPRPSEQTGLAHGMSKTLPRPRGK